MSEAEPILAAVLIGSKADWDAMRAASHTFDEFGIAHECRILSAHRTPEALSAFIGEAEGRGCEVFIAGAGGAAHLAGVVASQTLRPVLGVPMTSKLDGLDSLLSTVQMPAGIPVGTLAVGRPGAVNAALLAIAMLANHRPELREKLATYRDARAANTLEETLE